MITFLTDENNKIVATATTNSLDADDTTHKHYVDEQELPVSVNKLYLYCYSEEKGFYPNPDYTPPEEPIGETDNTILDLAEIAIDHEMRLSMLELGLTE